MMTKLLKGSKMKTDIKTILNLKYFFNILNSNNNCIVHNLKIPSRMLLKNIHLNWMQYTYSKTHKDMPVYLNRMFDTSNPTPNVYGYIKENLRNYDDENLILEHDLNNASSVSKSELKLDLFFPKEDAMQYFIKWQRYRKYWWSSISTTPSLFTVHDIKYEEKSANVDIVALLPEGIRTVENVSINFDKNVTSSQLSCSMCLENALKVLLLDGLTNNTKEYLRLHRKIAPYKVSFALDLTETDNKHKLEELAILLHQKLQANKISSWLPDFTQSYELQLKENLHLGVTYTAILSDDVLKDGIFRLMNSSTMLGEQVHVADFHKYGVMLFEK